MHSIIAYSQNSLNLMSPWNWMNVSMSALVGLIICSTMKTCAELQPQSTLRALDATGPSCTYNELKVCKLTGASESICAVCTKHQSPPFKTTLPSICNGHKVMAISKTFFWLLPTTHQSTPFKFFLLVCLPHNQDTKQVNTSLWATKWCQ